MNEDRRKVLLSGLFGAGWIGLRALATGLPLSLFMNPRTANADTPATCTATKPQYIYLNTSGGGDPLNANVPGTYDDPGIYHNTASATMTKTAMTLGSTTTSAAAPWAGLGALLNRTCFFHHGTYTNSHGDAAKVNRLMGAVMRQEMLVSMLSKFLAPCLKTVQEQPLVLSNNLITYNGGVMPVLGPSSLQAVLAAPTGPLANLQKIRDTHLDQLNALFKSTGNTAQKAILDQYALSQNEARSLSQQLLTDLASIGGTTRTDMNIAAAVLFKMNVSPVAVGNYSFGGDNHTDNALNGEATQLVASAAGIADFQARLVTYGLQDQVTMVFQNVFGRTLSMNAHSGTADGRNHNANHHCTVMIGAGFKGSLIGGLRLQDNGNDYQAMGIDSATGAKNDSGDIPYVETLGSMGKTLGRACGVAQTDLDTQITLGKVVPAALA
ncbi:MAG: DUF1501 domain-containing protein [Polyangiaceae bacterium]